MTPNIGGNDLPLNNIRAADVGCILAAINPLNPTGLTSTYAANLGALPHALRATRHQGTIVPLNLYAPTGRGCAEQSDRGCSGYAGHLG